MISTCVSELRHRPAVRLYKIEDTAPIPFSLLRPGHPLNHCYVDTYRHSCIHHLEPIQIDSNSVYDQSCASSEQCAKQPSLFQGFSKHIILFWTMYDNVVNFGMQPSSTMVQAGHPLVYAHQPVVHHQCYFSIPMNVTCILPVNGGRMFSNPSYPVPMSFSRPLANCVQQMDGSVRLNYACKADHSGVTSPCGSSISSLSHISSPLSTRDTKYTKELNKSKSKRSSHGSVNTKSDPTLSGNGTMRPPLTLSSTSSCSSSSGVSSCVSPSESFTLSPSPQSAYSPMYYASGVSSPYSWMVPQSSHVNYSLPSGSTSLRDFYAQFGVFYNLEPWNQS